jgi:hypothetical protein
MQVLTKASTCIRGSNYTIDEASIACPNLSLQLRAERICSAWNMQL